MAPAYLNLSPAPFASTDHYDLHHPSIFSTNNYRAAASSSSYITTHNFFDIASSQDPSEFYDHQQPQSPKEPSDRLAISFENEISDNGVQLSLGEKKEKYEDRDESSNIYQIKWMTSKMRLMHKMKKDDVDSPTPSNTNTVIQLEDQKQQPSSSVPIETDNYSNTNSSNGMISNTPIRVCSDCNTTRTPLWRSGPRGPKSLCNACGIRQRKARRAMVAANDTAFEKETTPPPVIKTKKHNKSKTKTSQQKDKTNSTGGAVNVARSKKRSCCNLINHHDEAQKKVCNLEDFLLTLTNNLAYNYQVFPQDQKDAAILLMALSFNHGHCYGSTA